MFSFVLTFRHASIWMCTLLQIIYSLLDFLQVRTTHFFFELTTLAGPPFEGLAMASTTFLFYLYNYHEYILRPILMVGPYF